MRAQVSEARDDRARRDAVLDQRHHHRVEDFRLFGIRRARGQLEERHVAQIEMPEDLSDEVFALDRDAVDGRPGEIRLQFLACH
jgi:hypothetical protein